jgi:hypothetical protein
MKLGRLAGFWKILKTAEVRGAQSLDFLKIRFMESNISNLPLKLEQN